MARCSPHGRPHRGRPAGRGRASPRDARDRLPLAQPFVASGDYQSLRELAGPRAVRKPDYGRDVGTLGRAGNTRTVDLDGPGRAAAFTAGDPDFTVRSLRGTAVLRWEYRRGPTAYLAWTRPRSRYAAAGTFDLGPTSSALFRDRPDDVFPRKPTYWIGR